MVGWPALPLIRVGGWVSEWMGGWVSEWVKTSGCSHFCPPLTEVSRKAAGSQVAGRCVCGGADEHPTLILGRGASRARSLFPEQPPSP